VINLVEDKGRAFEEAYRVLKEGGRLSISDIVASGAFPFDMAANAAGWASCVTGALPEKEYLDLVAQAGFGNIQIARSPDAFQVGDIRAYSLLVSAVK
jgi:ubiquinone/menaquinone biosynthesis C-methylase UbiE